MSERAVDVFVELSGQEEIFAGRLYARQARGLESATFEYDEGYIDASPRTYSLDPQLDLTQRVHQTAREHKLFGAFSDSAPDRWGRTLILRDERRRAGDGQASRQFGEIDYLLRVRDDLRMGALRYRDPESGEFLDSSPAAIPHLVDLPALLNAADLLERDPQAVSADAFRALLRGGSSLGGARPKAHVQDKDGRFAIAKFPSPSQDRWDVIRWEAIALGLARRAKIDVPDYQLHVVDDKAVLLVYRFDRRGAARVGYASAMTMLELVDGERASYLDLAYTIADQGDRIIDDLRELWRRVALTVLISNTDDHLRNHGFLRMSGTGWRLSPVFDINPDPHPGQKYLATAIDTSSDPDIEQLMSVAPNFELSEEDATEVLADVVQAVSVWREEARAAGLTAGQIADMEPAFEHDQLATARQLTGLPS